MNWNFLISHRLVSAIVLLAVLLVQIVRGKFTTTAALPFPRLNAMIFCNAEH